MKLKNILIIAMAIVTLGLVVACSDDVVVASKDNNTNFAQVLESNGAFEYAGTKYETLQDAIEAIDKAKGYAPKTIKVLRDGVKTGAATVPSTINGDGIALDLNGNSLSFLSSTGVTVNGVFKVTGNGEIILDDKSADATAFAVGKGGKFTIENTTINTGDQYAVKASGEGATVDLFGGAIIAGNIAASDKAHIDLKSGSVVSGTMSTSGSDTVVQVFGTLEGNVDALNSSSIELSNGSSFTGNINVLSGASLSVGSAAGTDPTIGAGSTITVSGANMTANKDAKNAELAMADGATVTVNDGGKIHITAFDNNSCTIICDDSKKAEIIEDADVNIDPENITDGFFKVAQDDGQIKYFSVLQDAVNSAVATTNNKKVTYVRDRLNTTGVSTDSSATISSALTIDMNGNSDRVVITVSAGTLTVKNTSSTKSTLVGILGNSGAGNITIDNVTVGRTDDEVADAVNITGALISTRSTFNATVTVGTLTDGEQDGTTYKNGSKFTKAIVVAGAINLKDSTLDPADGGSSPDYNAKFVLSNGSDSLQNNTTIAAITMNGVKFNYSADNSDVITKYAGVWADKGGSVSMTNSTGTAYKIIATNTDSSTLGTITINNSTMTTGLFTVKNEVAARVATGEYTAVYNDVTIRGYAAGTVFVDVIEAKDIMVSYVTVTVLNGEQSGTRAKSGNIISDNSVFESVVEASGYLTDGAEATSATPEKKGSTFKNAIRVTGTSSFYKSTFAPSNDGTEFYASTVEIKEAVFSTSATGESTGNLYNIEAKKTEIESSADVFAENLKITASTGFVGNLKTSGNTSNTVNEPATTYRYYSNIVVDNSSFTAESPAKTLSVGDVSSTYTGGTAAYGDVTIKGGTTANTVTVSSISLADAVKTSYAVVTGDIGSNTTKVTTVSDGWTVSESTTPGYSTFNGNIYASGAGTFNNSTFDTKNVSDKSVSGSTLSFTSSTFVKDDGTASPTAYTTLYALTASGANPDANTSALKITTSTGSVASLTAKAGSITVDNNAANANLTVTGAVSAYDNVSTYYDVTLTGPTTTGVALQVGAITGKKVDSTRATVTDTVVAKANVVSKLSLFQSTVTAVTTVADGTSASDLGNSEFQGNISANGDITLYGSKFSGTTDPTIKSEYAGNIGLYNCTGRVGNILSKGYYDSSVVTGSITINNSNAKANLNAMSVQSYYDINTDGDYDSDTDTAGTVEIVAPDYDSTLTTQPMLYFGNTSHNLYRITGSVTLKDGRKNSVDYTAGTLVLYGGSDHEIEGYNLTIYGGQYGDVGDSFCYTSMGTIKIHGGTCYINEVGMLQAVLEKVVGDYNNLSVNIYLGNGGPFTLTRSVTIGYGTPYLTGKDITIYGGTSTSAKTIYVPWDSNDYDSSSSESYRSYAINLASGNLIYSGVYIQPTTSATSIASNYYSCTNTKCTLAYDDPNGVPTGINGSYCGGYVNKY